jgi:hypothetical protein
MHGNGARGVFMVMVLGLVYYYSNEGIHLAEIGIFGTGLLFCIIKYIDASG